MTPLSNDAYSRDFHHFVLQEPILKEGYYYQDPPKKIFKIESTKKSDKSKKDLKKDKDQKKKSLFDLL